MANYLNSSRPVLLWWFTAMLFTSTFDVPIGSKSFAFLSCEVMVYLLLIKLHYHITVKIFLQDEHNNISN